MPSLLEICTPLQTSLISVIRAKSETRVKVTYCNQQPAQHIPGGGYRCLMSVAVLLHACEKLDLFPLLRYPPSPLHTLCARLFTLVDPQVLAFSLE
jgi:hypothetical protein